MSVESKYTLLAQNQSSFPNNTTGYITPEILREFNIDMIDSLVDELSFQAYSGSVYNQIVAVSASINASVSSLSQSVAISFSASNANVTALSTSVDIRLDNLELFSSSLDATFATDAQLAAVSAALDSAKVNNSQTSSMAVSSSTYAISSSYALTASFALNAGGINTGSLVTTSSFNALTQSFNDYTQSTNASISGLNTISASYLAFTQSYYTDSSSFSTRIDGITAGLGFVTTASFNAYTQSISESIADLEFKDTTFLTTGSITETQYISGALEFTGSARIKIATASFTNYGSGQSQLSVQYDPSASALTYKEVNTNLPQYLNQAVKVGMIATGSLVGGLVKVFADPSETGSIVDNTTTNEGGILFASQSTTDWRYIFGYNGNPEGDGGKAFVVQRGLHKLAGNATSIPTASLSLYPIGSPIYWSGQAQGACTLTRPTNGVVLRLGYIAAIENGVNPYVREIWYDPIWEEGETTYSPNISGSIIVNNQSNQLLPHITASAGSTANIIFKTNTNTTQTELSGSANLFVNPIAATAGFKRVATSGNIAMQGLLPQISSSMAFPITMSGNILPGSAQGIISRGPVSSSAWTITQNLVPGTINVGTSATLHAERIVNGLTINNNYIPGTLTFIANQTALSGSQPAAATANTIAGTSQIALSSSAVLYQNNSVNGTHVVENAYWSASVGVGRATIGNNTIGGGIHTLIISGGLLGATQPAFSNNVMFGANNTLYSNVAAAVLTGSTYLHSATNVAIIGHNLIVSASSATTLTSTLGSSFVGRFNAIDGNKAKTAETVFAVGTGTSTTNRKTGFLVDSGSNTFVEGTFNLNGSGNVTGSFDVSGSFTSSLESGKFYVGNASGRTTTVATSSYVSNTTDTYTSTPAVQQIVTLTQSEWNSISGSSNSNTLYIIM